MINIEIIAVGKLKDSSLLSIWQSYAKRMKWRINLLEIEQKAPDKTELEIMNKINSKSYLIILDETGQNISSTTFAKKIGEVSLNGRNQFQIIIGGADGLSKNILGKADFLLSFGKLTWPHMLVRILLIEQLYRAQQILAGHPYHRE